MAASVTTGVMNPLLGKLTKLLGDEYKKLTGVRKQASFLRDELSAMKYLLDKMELMDKLDPSAKNWRDHIREMSYDMENCIDDFMHDIEGADAKPSFVKKMAKRLRRLGRRHQIANRIEELKVLAVEANARRKRYKIDDCVDSSPRVVAIDPRISAIYKEAAGLVGIDGPIEELVSLLMDSQNKLKVVSIVGFGGLGKTTLAKQVYDKIGGEFECKAFLSVSQRPDMKSLLIGLQRKLGIRESSHDHELLEIIDRLKGYLKQKRYFILVDDVWDQSAWNFISCAFPENSNGSKAMVTTRLDDVALCACHNDHACIYRMKHLEEQDSRRLFFNRLLGSGNICPPQFKDISAEILKKCDGLPLAIITIASLLSCNEARSLNEWESIKNALGAKSATQPTLEEMRGILNLSYIHLPLHLRPCLLYLGMYPEDRFIERDDLVRQWIAEGFVCSSRGVDLEDVAKSYFNELINRSLIQPGETKYGEVLSCRVHDMLLDLILSKNTTDNFISVAYNYEDLARLHRCDYKVRRLSLKSSVGGTRKETLATSMTQVRSYACFGESMYTPPLSHFKYLRVLFFEFPYEWHTTVDLTAIGNLFLLRYLVVRAEESGVALPAEIQKLVHLETLELVCDSRPKLSIRYSSIDQLDSSGTSETYSAAQRDSEHEICPHLRCSGISESSLEDIKGLSELTNLKKLELSMFYDIYRILPPHSVLMVEHFDALVSSIGMLRDLKYLTIDCKVQSHGYERLSDSLPDPPPSLQVLKLNTWQFSRVPKWIGELPCLRVLCLCVVHLSSDEVRVIGGLPSLVSASFNGLDVSQDKVMVDAGLFLVLEVVSFMSDEDVTAWLSFEAGAMPKLRWLGLGLGWKEWRGATPVGMEYLPCLQDIQVWLRIYVGPESKKDWRDSGCRVRADVLSAFRTAASVHPRHPSVMVL